MDKNYFIQLMVETLVSFICCAAPFSWVSFTLLLRLPASQSSQNSETLSTLALVISARCDLRLIWSASGR